MERLKIKHGQIIKALDSLEKSITNFKNFDSYPKNLDFIDQEEFYRTLRDSMIQRFEFSVDLFWKYIKIYLKEKINHSVKIIGAKHVIRDACNAKLISEKDTETILKMIDDRNMSSHIYKEEIADQIGSRIGDYYEVIKTHVDKLTPQ